MFAHKVSDSKIDQGEQVWRSIGYWMAILMGLSQAANAVRAFVDPSGFASYMGLPLVDGSDPDFVYVYGLRTTFIAILVGIFAVMRNVSSLKWMGLAALVMPLGDVILTVQAGADTAIIIRHTVITAYVAATVLFLHTWTRKYKVG